MNFSKELIQVLEKAKDSKEYFNPFLLFGIINSIMDYDPEGYSLVSKDLLDWAEQMFSR